MVWLGLSEMLITYNSRSLDHSLRPNGSLETKWTQTPKHFNDRYRQSTAQVTSLLLAGTTEQLRLEQTLKESGPPFFVKGSLYYLIQWSIQLHFETSRNSEEVVPLNDCSYCKKCVSYIEMKPFLVPFGLIIPCLLHVSPCEKASVLFSAGLGMFEHCDNIPPELSLLQ